MKAGERILNSNSKDPEVYVRSGREPENQNTSTAELCGFYAGELYLPKKKSILLCFIVYIFIFFLWCLRTISKYCSQISVENG